VVNDWLSRVFSRDQFLRRAAGSIKSRFAKSKKFIKNWRCVDWRSDVEPDCVREQFDLKIKELAARLFFSTELNRSKYYVIVVVNSKPDACCGSNGFRDLVIQKFSPFFDSIGHIV
jgi:hypothetical protein